MAAKKTLFSDDTREVESPFLDKESFATEADKEWGLRVADLLAQSPFHGTFKTFEEGARYAFVPEVCEEDRNDSEAESVDENVYESESYDDTEFE